MFIHNKCPRCKGSISCLGGRSAHWSNWYCDDPKMRVGGLEVNNGAVLSKCQTYRYALWRTVDEDFDQGEGDIIGYFGVNPSTADHKIDDQTVMKWRGFSERIPTPKCTVSRFIVGNLFAYRATDVNVLKSVDDPIGSMNDHWIDKIIEKSTILVPCWGNSSKVPKDLRYRITEIEDKLKQSGKPVFCFGKTNSGCPKHPLMLGYDTPIERYFK